MKTLKEMLLGEKAPIKPTKSPMQRRSLPQNSRRKEHFSEKEMLLPL